EWLRARIRELPLTSVDAGSRQRLTVRDVGARKLARGLQIHNPHFNLSRFLQDCGFTAIYLCTRGRGEIRAEVRKYPLILRSDPHSPGRADEPGRPNGALAILLWE